MNDLLALWQKDAQTRGMTSDSIRSYRYIIQRYLTFLDGQDPVKVDKTTIRAYVDFMRSNGAKVVTVGHHLTAISNFYGFLIFENMAKANPVLDTRKRYVSCYKNDSEASAKKLISVKEAAHLVNSAFDIRDKAMIILLLKTGVRRRELLAMDVADINWQDQSILLKPTKKRSNRTVFFDAEAARYLRAWLRVREDRNQMGSDALWITSWGRRPSTDGGNKIFRKAAIRAGLHNGSSKKIEDHLGPHCCRHWFTTHLRRAGMPREFIQELRGDSRREAIDIYDHIDKLELRESYLARIPQLGV